MRSREQRRYRYHCEACGRAIPPEVAIVALDGLVVGQCCYCPGPLVPLVTHRVRDPILAAQMRKSAKHSAAGRLGAIHFLTIYTEVRWSR